MKQWEHNPGSKGARDNGCTCAVLDNHHGKGVPGKGGPLFWITGDCPLHDRQKSREAAAGMEGEFRPCKIIMEEAGVTQFVFEDRPYTSKPVVPGRFHEVDWLIGFDGKLVGLQFWTARPGATP